MYKLILLRHGRSLADDEEKHEGRYDSPLTSIGIDQAKITLQELKKMNFSFNAIITSTLMRAQTTAEIINEEFNVPIIKSELFMERDNGKLAGLMRKDAESKFPKAPFLTPFSYFPDMSGENLVLLHARALRALDFVFKNQPGHYLIVSHGGFLNALIRVILGIQAPINDSGVVFQFRDNGYMEIDYFEENHKWVIRSLK